MLSTVIEELTQTAHKIGFTTDPEIRRTVDKLEQELLELHEGGVDERVIRSIFSTIDETMAALRNAVDVTTAAVTNAVLKERDRVQGVLGS